MNKSLFLILMICGLILSALIIRNGKLLLLVMPFLAYLIIGAVQAPTGMNLVARRVIEKPSVVAGEPNAVHLSVTNEGNPLFNIYLSDLYFPQMRILDGQAHQRISLSAGEGVELHYRFQGDRGIYTWNSIHATASDPFGLFELRKEIKAYGEVMVRPGSMSLDRVSLKPRTTLHAPGPISVRLAGSSTDFLGIREYQSGDSLRRLNWRLAARHPRQLFTNEYEREEIADFGLILDARKLTNAEGAEEALFEHSIRATLSLSESFLKAGNRVSLLVFGETMSSLFPGYGKKQLNHIMRKLAHAKLGSNISLGYLQYFPTRLFPSRSILIVLSTVGIYDHEAYARLRSFGYDILLISPDPVDHACRALPETQINALAGRAARVERMLQLKQLMKLGIHVIDWRVDQPLQPILQETARYVTHRRDL